MKMINLIMVLLLVIPFTVSAEWYDDDDNTYQDQNQYQDQQVNNDYVTNINTPCNECTNVTEINNTYELASTELSRGIASVTAMTSIPLHPDTKGGFSLGVGAGSYNDENAGAVGLTYHVSSYAFKANLGKAQGARTAYGVGAAVGF